MQRNKLDRIISIIKEQMVVGAGGFTGSADSKGPTAGFDPVMGFSKRKKPQYAKGGIGSRKKWLDYLKNK